MAIRAIHQRIGHQTRCPFRPTDIDPVISILFRFRIYVNVCSSRPASSPYAADLSHAEKRLTDVTRVIARRDYATSAIGKGSSRLMTISPSRLARLEPARVCIIKPSSLGDVVHALPILAALRGAGPRPILPGS